LKLSFEQHLEYKPEMVFSVYRDKMEEYVKFIPNIVKIIIEKREELEGGKTRLNVIWEGMGQIPDSIRSHLKPEMIRWRDDELWDPEARVCSWNITPYYFTDFVVCNGMWHFDPHPKGGTKIWLEGIFTVNIRSWPGFPKPLLRFASRVIEKMIGGYVEPNLKANIAAVKKILKQEAGC
jgi:hypothetical protein